MRNTSTIGYNIISVLKCHRLGIQNPTNSWLYVGDSRTFSKHLFTAALHGICRQFCEKALNGSVSHIRSSAQRKLCKLRVATLLQHLSEGRIQLLSSSDPRSGVTKQFPPLSGYGRWLVHVQIHSTSFNIIQPFNS